jgi:hypothetical protein
MQSIGPEPRAESPNPEEDTLLQPLSHSSDPQGQVDPMPAVKKVGDERGMRDTIGLVLVIVCHLSADVSVD